MEKAKRNGETVEKKHEKLTLTVEVREKDKKNHFTIFPFVFTVGQDVRRNYVGRAPSFKWRISWDSGK